MTLDEKVSIQIYNPNEISLKEQSACMMDTIENTHRKLQRDLGVLY